jgi:hypothetical protein
MRKTPFDVGCGHHQWSCERKYLVQLSFILFWSFRDRDMEHKEFFTTGMSKFQNEKWRNKRKTLRNQSNGASEFEYDQRVTVALHS